MGPVYPRDIIYTKTRLRVPSTDQSSGRPPHRKKCTRTAKCFFGSHLGTGKPSPGQLCLLEPNEGAWLKDIWYRDAHYVCCL
ncbi:uncharacterized protein TNCV_771711 [Trichonephila clavipes]|nr:uncharacterized protein TNCV_771711 [Trichonephila clavipes]